MSYNSMVLDHHLRNIDLRLADIGTQLGLIKTLLMEMRDDTSTGDKKE
jgi:hypothetical protein